MIFKIIRIELFIVWAFFATIFDLFSGKVSRSLSIIFLFSLLLLSIIEYIFADKKNTAWNSVFFACAAIFTFCVVRKFVGLGLADVWFSSGIGFVLCQKWVFAVLLAICICTIFMLLLKAKRLPFIPFLAWASCLFLILPTPIFPSEQNITESFEFIDQDVTDILYSVSVFSGVPVVADDTVSGKASFRFSGGNRQQAFQAFLTANRLYQSHNEGIITVSKVRIFTDDVGSVQVDCYDVPPNILFDKISVACGITIIYDALPTTDLSVHLSNVTSFEALCVIARQLGEYEVKEQDNIFYINRIVTKPTITKINEGLIDISLDKIAPESYSFNIQNALFSEVLEKLFAEGKRQYCISFKSQVRLLRTVFTDKDFDKSLRLICSQCDCDFVISDNIYYIFDNSSLVSNSKSDISESSIRNTGKKWNFFSLQYIKNDLFFPLFKNRFSEIPFIQLPNESSFLCLVDEKTAEKLNEFIGFCDVPKKLKPIILRYITTEEFLSHLPSSVSANEFSATGRNNTLFFSGTDEAYKKLLTELEYIDQPVKTIRYDLLVIQYQKTSNFSHKIGASVSPVQLGSIQDFSAALGSVISLNVDILSVFGLQFAAELQSAISENEAKVFADTTLHGVSGSSIDFQNTNTFRYRDSEINPETGKPVNTGVTREIVAGLVLNVQGWVSGDGTITTKVKASVSRRGAETSGEKGNPPPTSEKSISTEVRCKSGEPVVLSGLVQDDSTIVEQRIPVLSKIPLFGWLFKSTSRVEEATEMVIYLVPHIVDGKKLEA